jgi:hypothetical protein
MKYARNLFPEAIPGFWRSAIIQFIALIRLPFLLLDLAIFIHRVTAFSAGSNYALNEKENLLYHLRPAAQPAVVPYFLSSYNLSTGEIIDLTDFYTNVTGPVAYDPDTELIFFGVKDGLQIADKVGTNVDKILSSRNIRKIIIRK